MDLNTKSGDFLNYFNSLPVNTQESILQCGVDYQTVSELQEIAAAFNGEKDNKNQ